MKKTVCIISAALLFLAVFPAAAQIKMAVNRPEIVDWKGSSFGNNIPEWVVAAGDEDGALVASTKGLEGRKSWVVTVSCNNYDEIEQSADVLSVANQIAASIYVSMSEVVSRECDDLGYSDSRKSQLLTMYQYALNNLTLNGLEKVDSYWVQARTLKAGLKRARSGADYDYSYTVYSIFSMDESLWTRQLEAALSGINTSTKAATLLKEAVIEDLSSDVSFVQP